MRLAATHPHWGLGFEDEVGWRRVSQPSVSAWPPPVSRCGWWRSRSRADPDPNALACSAVVLRAATPAPDQRWRRFVDGRPVSAITIQCRDWCAPRRAGLGTTARRLGWDNACWPLSYAGRSWLQAHHRQVKARGTGVRILSCFLPVKSPWRNPIEPQRTHGTRAVLAPDRRLAALALADRVDASYACDHEPHRTIPEPVA